MNKIKLERKKGKNIQKRAKKKETNTELTALSKELNKIKLEKKKGYSKKGKKRKKTELKQRFQMNLKK
jgi:hypothetical protein